jgi:nucleoside-triphosphatase THEP1
VIAALTGPIGVGKTTLCQRILDALRSEGRTAGGVLSPALLDGMGRKIGIRLLRIDTGEERVLALTGGDLKGPSTGPYSFDAGVFAWGTEAVRAALQVPCSLVLVDEIGLLELLKGEGFAPILDDLSAPVEASVLIVVRDTLTEMLKQRLGRPTMPVYTLSVETRDSLFSRIVDDCMVGG